MSCLWEAGCRGAKWPLLDARSTRAVRRDDAPRRPRAGRKGAIVSAREQQLVDAMRVQGWDCRQYLQSWVLTEIPIQPYTRCTGPLPYTFKSIQSAADYLCPIVRDTDFTALVAA